MTQLHHSFLHHQNNSPANHIAQFVSRAAQILCFNSRAVLYCVQETNGRLPEKNLHQIDRQPCRLLVQDDL